MDLGLFQRWMSKCYLDLFTTKENVNWKNEQKEDRFHARLKNIPNLLNHMNCLHVLGTVGNYIQVRTSWTIQWGKDGIYKLPYETKGNHKDWSMWRHLIDPPSTFSNLSCLWVGWGNNLHTMLNLINLGGGQHTKGWMDSPFHPKCTQVHKTFQIWTILRSIRWCISSVYSQ
jgi:hypothetical protein